MSEAWKEIGAVIERHVEQKALQTASLPSSTRSTRPTTPSKRMAELVSKLLLGLPSSKNDTNKTTEARVSFLCDILNRAGVTDEEMEEVYYRGAAKWRYVPVPVEILKMVEEIREEWRRAAVAETLDRMETLWRIWQDDKDKSALEEFRRLQKTLRRT